MSLFHDVSNFAGSCQPVRNILHGQFCTAYTIFGAYFTCLLTSLSKMWLCANGSTGIIINIDTISNINLKAGMCHMEVDWFITYRIWWERFKNMHFFHATQWLFAYLICAERVLIKTYFLRMYAISGIWNCYDLCMRLNSWIGSSPWRSSL